MPRRAVWILLLLPMVIVACDSGPKAKARDWADRFPDEIASWELDDEIELTAENQAGFGHITRTYEGADDTIAYLSIDVYATSTAADVALAQLIRQWELNGARFESQRFGVDRLDFADTPGGRFTYTQVDETILTLTVIPEAPGTELNEDEIEVFWETIVEVIRNNED